jgi:tetratricopeptide (TPR) repeat protein
VSAALEAVIRKCLAPEPADRYPSAARLAADLQAVADDGPLRCAREPQPARALRWAARNRRPIALAAAALLLAATAGAAAFRAQAETYRREATVRQLLAAGRRAEEDGELVAASAQFARAADLSRDRRTLRTLHDEAESLRADADATQHVRARADALFRQVEPLRFRLITGKALKTIAPELERVLEPFQVLTRKDWGRDPALGRLDAARRTRLFDEVNEVLFLWVWASNPRDPEECALAAALCDRALRFATPQAPWRALRARYEPGPAPAPAPAEVAPADEGGPVAQARGDFQRGLVALLGDTPAHGLYWLERAVASRPDHFWYQFTLAFYCEHFGETDRALAHYGQAISLRPDSAWAHFNRALLYAKKRAWGRARDDLARARRRPEGLDPMPLHFEAGRLALELGNFPAALAELNAAIESAPDPQSTAAARLTRARLFAGLGAVAQARADLVAVLDDDPADANATLGLSALDLRDGRASEADAALTRLLDAQRGRAVRPAELLHARALARLLLGQAAQARDDAAELLRQGATPARLRLWTRVALALGRDADLGQLHPDDADRLPVGGLALRRDLRAAADRLRPRSDGTGGLPALLTRAAVLSALGAYAEALADADRAVALHPDSPQAVLTRARVRRRSGDLAGALADAEHGTAVDPDDARLIALRGSLLVETGRPIEGLAALELASTRGAGAPAHAARARAWHDLGRYAEARDAWNQALITDPDDPGAFVGRARAFLRLGQWDQALADLEDATDLAPADPPTRRALFLTYASVLPARPNRLPRVVSLARATFLDR